MTSPSLDLEKPYIVYDEYSLYPDDPDDIDYDQLGLEIEWYWEEVKEYFSELLKVLNPGEEKYWVCSVDNFGWRNSSGFGLIGATNDGGEVLSKVLPNTDCTFHIFKTEEGTVKIRNWHHDSPRGNEWYTLYLVDDYEAAEEEQEQVIKSWRV